MDIVFWNRPSKMGNKLRLTQRVTGGYYCNSKDRAALKRNSCKWNETLSELEVVKPWQDREARARNGTACKRPANKAVRKELNRLQAFDEGMPFDEDSLRRDLKLHVRREEEEKEDFYPFEHHFDDDDLDITWGEMEYEMEENPRRLDSAEADRLMAEEVGEFERMLDRALGLDFDW